MTSPAVGKCSVCQANVMEVKMLFGILSSHSFLQEKSLKCIDTQIVASKLVQICIKMHFPQFPNFPYFSQLKFRLSCASFNVSGLPSVMLLLFINEIMAFKIASRSLLPRCDRKAGCCWQ